MAFTAPKVNPSSWLALFDWILKRDTSVVSSSRAVWCNDWKSHLWFLMKLLTIHPVVCVYTSMFKRQPIVCCVGKLWNHCEMCSNAVTDVKTMNVFTRRTWMLKEMECVDFYTWNWRQINFSMNTPAASGLFFFSWFKRASFQIKTSNILQSKWWCCLQCPLKQKSLTLWWIIEHFQCRGICLRSHICFGPKTYCVRFSSFDGQKKTFWGADQNVSLSCPIYCLLTPHINLMLSSYNNVMISKQRWLE